MQVKMTVSQLGGKTGNSYSQSITLKDAATVEEVQQVFAKEFGALFPRYGSLEAGERKKSKAKE